MILLALKEYYDRKAADPSAQIAPEGFEWKEIPFVLVLDKTGNLVQIEDTREGEGRKKRARTFLVPQAVKRSSGTAANLYWDNPAYVLGIKTKSEGKRDAAPEQHFAFRKRFEDATAGISDEGIEAIKAFYLKTDYVDNVMKQQAFEEIKEVGPFISFRLAGQTRLICEREAVRNSLIKNAEPPASEKGLCLLTGEKAEILELHASIKGVYGANTTGGNIVSFNLDAFNSFAKTKGNNSPVSKSAAFAYTTALNHLLNKQSKQHMLVGEATTVFWAAKAERLEEQMADIFGEPEKDDPERNTRTVRELYKSIENGAYVNQEGDTLFYVLGLSPNAARIAVRFWNVCTVRELASNIRQHFDDLMIAERGPKDQEYPSLFRLLVHIASQEKADNIPPNIAGEFMRSILAGIPYPRTLLQASVLRNKVEQGPSYYRVCLIKACINREIRYKNSNQKEELRMSLDEQNLNIGYRLGRLFAVLQKTQEEASPGINTTIRDRYYASASGTPTVVFPILIRLKNHHIAKLENKGRVVNLEKLIGEIHEGISEYPPHLALADQGRFAVGYYHQYQNFFKKGEEK
ncbi:MAG TPA: type I-C CRISPR-associated protein Cas8c/Csd1 [Chitinivibrionales bacterium]|nr:type I-C CRISPR-associated protein Cas8c/Csd1 [Chitinivibrionales bacterium]